MWEGIFWAVVRIVAVSYLGLAVLVFFTQSGYVYYPDRVVGLTPAYFGIPFDDVTIVTEDGERLAAWHVPAKRTGDALNATLLFCHGNAGNMGDRLDSIRTFHNLGLNVLIFDYRGYGDSTGKPSERGTYLDAAAAWRHLTGEMKIQPEKIVVFGRSLGGAVAAQLAADVAPGALCIESTFTSAPDMAVKMFPYLPIRWLCRFRYNTLQRVGQVKCPVLVAHSRDDDMIPFSHGRRIFEAAKEPKIFVEMTGPHNSGGMDADTKYQAVFAEVLSKYVTCP